MLAEFTIFSIPYFYWIVLIAEEITD